MELKVKTEKENPALQRMEVEGTITFQGATPSNKEMQEKLAKKYGTKPELVAMRNIYNKFGGGSASFEAAVYKTKEQYNKVEAKKVVEPAPEEKKEDAPAAEAPKAEEKPAEEKKEEVKEAPKAEEKKDEKPAEEKKEEKAEKKEEPKAEEKPAENKGE